MASERCMYVFSDDGYQRAIQRLSCQLGGTSVEKVSKDDMVRVSGSDSGFDGHVGVVIMPGKHVSKVAFPSMGENAVDIFPNECLSPYVEEDYAKPRPMDIAASLKGDDRPAPNGDEFEAQMLEVLAHECKPAEFPSWWVSAVRAMDLRDAKRLAIRAEQEQKGA